MKTIKFNKTQCRVDFSINVIYGADMAAEYLLPSFHNADYFEILVFKRGNGHLFLDDRLINIMDNSILFVSPFQRKKWKVEHHLLDFTILIFQEDFLNEFFTDKLLVVV